MDNTLRTEASEKEKANIHYFNESSTLERRLDTIAELCISSCDPDRISPSVVAEIGEIIKNYLDSKRILDHYFFERPIDEDSYDDLFLKAELYKLDERYSPMPDFVPTEGSSRPHP